MSLEIKVKIQEPESIVEGLPNDHDIRNLARDTENTLYLVTMHDPKQTPDEERRLGQIDTELKQIEERYRKLFKRVYGKNSPRDIRDIVYGLLFGRDDPRKVKKLNRYAKIIEDLTVKRTRFNFEEEEKRYSLFIGDPNTNLTQAQITSFDMFRDGGTTFVDYVFNGKEGRLFFPSSWNPMYANKSDSVTFRGKTLELEELKAKKRKPKSLVQELLDIPLE